ncbi:phosphonate ABC transporter, permease protein PhnE [Mangrovicoccus ximenensis]|uniref:phosphonate ABC transporter, permease protein PhnE n=1 Tax=Mangrovicoccus ximenensis TaxID=1911570 RepID=UPI000D380526|nr:phosphonate ABC transporter, permease protein PhnE [Mangrovicoccus ximenensis]
MTDLASPPTGAIRDSYMAELRRRRLYGGLALLVFAALMAAGFRTANDRNAGGFLDGLHRVGDYPAMVLSEAWEKRAQLPAKLLEYLPDLVETLNIAAVSTLAGALAGTVLAFLSIPGLAPWPRMVPLFRRLMDLMRAIPEIVIALMLIFVLGGGPVPAVIAIAFHTAGALGKLFSEVAENADAKPVEGLASVGAAWGQRMALGVLPQVAPNFLSYALLRFEINVRASAILGFVGAGGIGYELKNAMAWGPGRFGDAAAIFVLLFGAIVAFDQLSGHVRRRLVEGTRT